MKAIIRTTPRPMPISGSGVAASKRRFTQRGVIAAQTGLRPVLVRPPYGEMSESGLDWLAGAGYVMTNWSVDSGDWRAENADQIMINILLDLNPGSVILFHSAGGTGQDLTSTVKATEDLLYTLWGLGYEIVTLPELLSVPAYR